MPKATRRGSGALWTAGGGLWMTGPSLTETGRSDSGGDMTAPHDVPTLRIRSVADLLAIIPPVLGFHPSESLVLVVVDAGKLVVAARIDLVHCAAGPLDERLGALWRQYPRALFLAVAYSADPVAAWRSLDALDDAAPQRLDLFRLHADGARWFDAPGAPGQSYDITCAPAAAQAAYEGLVARGTRRDLEASVEQTATSRQVAKALKALAKRNLDHDGLIRAALGLVQRADDGHLGRLHLNDAAVLAVASRDLAFRESAIVSTSRANAEARIGLWLQVVQGTTPGRSGHALVILGLAAWVAGNGALQVVCMEKASGVPTDGEWLGVLDQVNRQVLSPDHWEQLRADWYCAHVASLSDADEPAEAG